MFRVFVKFIALLTLFLFLSACASNAAPPLGTNIESTTYPRDEHGEVLAFSPMGETEATQIVDEAIIKAAATNKQALIVMGTNTCHDSRALATHFETPKFKTLLGANYILEYIDVGWKTDNLHIANRFGLDGIKGTPTVVIVDGTGKVKNLENAPTWRNAANRDEADVYEYFRSYAYK